MKKTIRLTERELNHIIKDSIKKVVLQPHILSEGVRYDSNTNTFTFDFEHDNETDIIKLQEIGHTIDAFGRCYHYGYEFDEDVDSRVRTEFIRRVKFPKSFDDDGDLVLFIKKAIDYLDSKITIPRYNVIVCPQSLSELNQRMLPYLTRITTTKYLTMELVKELPSKIEFDYDRFMKEVLDSTVNGKPRYTQQDKLKVLEQIHKMMDDIHKNAYFSIARDVKKTKYRQYIKNYYRFKDEEARNAYLSITNTNVILLDDIVTTGATIYQMLNTLRCLNDSNDIVVFSLIGKSTV